tara:strand:+ start:135 stop:296 length:162 start_codon:yes stop_codon:yes gene_type:complete
MRLRVELELDDHDCDADQWSAVIMDIKEILEHWRNFNEKGEVEGASISDPELH